MNAEVGADHHNSGDMAMRTKALIAFLMLAAGFACVHAADVEGSATGTWVNPIPSTAITTGLGTSNFTWGTGINGSGPSSLDFVGMTFATEFETPFKIGTVAYFNGTIALDSQANSIQLALALALTNPLLTPVLGSYGFELINTPNTTDADASADFVNLPSAFGGLSFLVDSTAYQLKLLGFRDVMGDGFLVSDPLQFHVREQGSASADLYAIVTTQAIPEPTTYLLLLLGLLAIGAVAHNPWRARL